MNDYLMKISWPLSSLGEALQALARLSKLSNEAAGVPSQPQNLEGDDEALGRWLDDAARGMNLEAKPFFCSYSELEQAVLTSGPALLRLRDVDSEGTRFLALIGRKGRSVSILDSRLREHKVQPSLV